MTALDLNQCAFADIEPSRAQKRVLAVAISFIMKVSGNKPLPLLNAIRHKLARKSVEQSQMHIEKNPVLESVVQCIKTISSTHSESVCAGSGSDGENADPDVVVSWVILQVHVYIHCVQF